MDLKKLDLKPHKLFHHLDRVTKFMNDEYFPPVHVEIGISDLCNQKCHFCYSNYLGHQKLEIPKDLLLKIMANLGKTGVRSLFFQGTGEPLINKAAADAIVTAKNGGVDTALQTNGVLMDRKFIDTALSSLSWVRVSSLEANRELYAKTHGCSENQYDKLIDNLKYAVEYRNKHNLSTVIAGMIMAFPYNADHMYDTVKLCKDIGLDYVMIRSAQMSLNNPEHNWDRKLHKDQREIFEKAESLQDDKFRVSMRWDQFEYVERGHKNLSQPFDKCYGLEFETMIDADARVYPCFIFWRNPEYCIGDLNKNTFEEIWKSKRRYEVLRKIYYEWDLKECALTNCKQCHINEDLWKLKNPPMHKNFL
jgi:GTP 3',8-cyclase